MIKKLIKKILSQNFSQRLIRPWRKNMVPSRGEKRVYFLRTLDSAIFFLKIFNATLKLKNIFLYFHY